VIPFAVATGGFLIVLLVAEYLNSNAGRAVAKTAASCCFLGTALTAGAGTHPYGQWVLAALALCWLGDVCLLGKSRAPFLAGLVSFLLGHLVFAAAFVIRGIDLAASGVALVVLVVVLIPVFRWLIPRVEAKMKGPVIAYMIVITAMVALATGTVIEHGQPMILVAAVAFYVSDLAVARDRFIKQGFSNRAWGLPLYYGAVVIFAITAAPGG
jgi:uncharacterized membrane protein YhhN